jgi:hypothetical protein
LDGFPPFCGCVLVLGASGGDVFGLKELTKLPKKFVILDVMVTGLDALGTGSGFLYSVVASILYKIDTFYMKIS